MPCHMWPVGGYGRGHGAIGGEPAAAAEHHDETGRDGQLQADAGGQEDRQAGELSSRIRTAAGLTSCSEPSTVIRKLSMAVIVSARRAGNSRNPKWFA
jgi:hypothetical protein